MNTHVAFANFLALQLRGSRSSAGRSPKIVSHQFGKGQAFIRPGSGNRESTLKTTARPHEESALWTAAQSRGRIPDNPRVVR